jgi:hypothetical protein
MTDEGTLSYYDVPLYNSYAKGNITSQRYFDDKSYIMYCGNGRVIVSYDPQRFLPKAILYYWHIERRQTHITTWEDVWEADRRGKNEQIPVLA